MTSGSEKVLTKMNRCAKGNIEVIEKVNYINFEQKVAGGQGLENYLRHVTKKNQKRNQEKKKMVNIW